MLASLIQDVPGRAQSGSRAINLSLRDCVINNHLAASTTTQVTYTTVVMIVALVLLVGLFLAVSVSTSSKTHNTGLVGEITVVFNIGGGLVQAWQLIKSLLGC